MPKSVLSFFEYYAMRLHNTLQRKPQLIQLRCMQRKQSNNVGHMVEQSRSGIVEFQSSFPQEYFWVIPCPTPWLNMQIIITGFLPTSKNWLSLFLICSLVMKRGQLL